MLTITSLVVAFSKFSPSYSNPSSSKYLMLSHTSLDQITTSTAAAENTIMHSAIMMNDMLAVPPAISFSVIWAGGL